jgi:hypothetical protein
MYRLRYFWYRLNDGARMLIVMWFGFIAMLLAMGAFGLL